MMVVDDSILYISKTGTVVTEGEVLIHCLRNGCAAIEYIQEQLHAGAEVMGYHIVKVSATVRKFIRNGLQADDTKREVEEE